MPEHYNTPRSDFLVVLADIFGWIYFSAWTASFYPQIFTNHKQRSTEGLSYAFAVFNLIGFVCLASFNVIRYRVQKVYNLTEAVEIQDLCFALHAMVLSFVVCLQILYYDWRVVGRRLNRKVALVSLVLIIAVLLHLMLALARVFPLTPLPTNRPKDYTTLGWSFTAFAGAVKLVITLIKYVPQIFLNHERQMTKGMAIWTFNFDLAGGVFSLSQTFLDAFNYNTTSYITGNLPKIGIGLVSLTYNCIILAQHYWLYRDKNIGTEMLRDNLSRKTTSEDEPATADRMSALYKTKMVELS